MKNKFIAIFCLSLFLMQNVFSMSNMTMRGIHLHSTRSTKQNKKFRSIQLLPIQANIDVNKINIVFSQSMGEIEIVIRNNNNQEVICDDIVSILTPTTLSLNLESISKGEYTIYFVLADEIIFGEYIIE